MEGFITLQNHVSGIKIYTSTFKQRSKVDGNVRRGFEGILVLKRILCLIAKVSSLQGFATRSPIRSGWEKHTTTKKSSRVTSETNQEDIFFKSSQDHSKYAVNDIHHVFIGDINRMVPQYHRGGGGIVFVDSFMNQTIQSMLTIE